MSKTEIYGIVSDGHYERFLCIEEYEYWMSHILPFGWMIIVKPIGNQFK